MPPDLCLHSFWIMIQLMYHKSHVVEMLHFITVQLWVVLSCNGRCLQFETPTDNKWPRKKVLTLRSWNKQIFAVFILRISYAGDAGGAEGDRRRLRRKSSEEGRHPAGRRRGLHHDREAHPGPRPSTPLPHPAVLLFPDTGKLTCEAKRTDSTADCISPV